jgi:pyridoxine 4-dehydrogenase
MPPNGPSATAAGELTLGGDLTVRRMGFGAMRITGEGIWGEPDDPEGAKALLHRVLELGVNLIDTADSYGPEVSENLIREALHPYPEDLVIATKGGLLRDGPGQWRRNCRPERLKQACDASLRRLGVERIDVYQLHAVDPDVPIEESVGALAELREEGKVRHVGLSNVGRGELAKAREIVPVVSVQNRYSITARDSEEVLKTCESEGLGFIPWFPIDAGALANAGSKVDELAERHGATPAQLVLAWLLRHSRAMLPIPGTSSVEHLEENVAAGSIALDDDEASALEEAVAP